MCELQGGEIPRRSHKRLGLLVLLSALASTAASADEPSRGAALMSLSGELGVLDPQGANDRERLLLGGLQGQVLLRVGRWPVFAGLGVGILWFAQSSQRGSSTATLPSVGDASYGSLSIERSLELRHADLMLRVQPWWGPVRPYLEGQLGVAGLWSTASLRDMRGVELDREESQRAVTYLAGASVGLDIRLMTLSDDAGSRWDLVLSLGARRLYTGPLALRNISAQDGDDARVSSVRERMRVWQPFLALTVSLGTAPRAPRESYESP